MTPFMLRVAELVAAPDPDAGGYSDPAVRPSAAVPASVGADRQVAVRALAEQLVCEANAVLPGPDDHLTLVDEAVPDELVFTVGYRGRAARVSTRFADGVARGQLVDDVGGPPAHPAGPVELVGPDALPDLLVRLLVVGGVPHHPGHPG